MHEMIRRRSEPVAGDRSAGVDHRSSSHPYPRVSRLARDEPGVSRTVGSHADTSSRLTATLQLRARRTIEGERPESAVRAAQKEDVEP